MSDPSVFEEVLEASAILPALPDVARAEAWGSSALSVWREDDDADQIDVDFVAWLLDRGDEPSMLLLLSVADALGLDGATRALARRRLVTRPAWVSHIGSASVTRAWEVVRGRERSVGIGFRHGDGSEISLLGDLDDDGLYALVVAPGPDELFDEAEDLVAPAALDARVAAGMLVGAWRQTLASGAALPESVLVNSAIARRRLEVALDTTLDDLRSGHSDVEPDDDVDPAERAELDAWARSTLVSALGLDTASQPGAGSIPGELFDPFSAVGRARYPAEEREAFGALEWADWLGAVIGLVRSGTGEAVTPSVIVDHINRCPEVTSTVPKRDRPYYEWAWQHVVALWQRHGLVDSGRRLTDAGVSQLPWVLYHAWTSRPVDEARSHTSS